MKELSRFRKYLAEEVGDQFTTGQSLIRKVTPEVEKSIEAFKNKYPNVHIKLISNNSIARVRRDRKDLIGTFTLSYTYKINSPEEKQDIEDTINTILGK